MKQTCPDCPKPNTFQLDCLNCARQHYAQIHPSLRPWLLDMIDKFAPDLGEYIQKAMKKSAVQ